MAELSTEADAKKGVEPIATETEPNPDTTQPCNPYADPATSRHQADAYLKDMTDNNEDPQIDGEIKKKKRKARGNKPGLLGRRKGATGFEEYFAEGPITSEEAQLEKSVLYNTDRPFVDRIEECIQRYFAKRRVSNERRLILDKYLFLGGIDPSPKQFAGGAGDADALAEADKDTARLMVANTFVGDGGERFYSIADAHNWVVDFSGIVKGFLSRTVPEFYAYDEDAFKNAADTVKNFLNYVLLHDVCPEYRDDILVARDICEIAPIELRCVRDIEDALPGRFHSMAAEIFSPRQDTNGSTGDCEQQQHKFKAFCLYQILCTRSNKDFARETSQMQDSASLRVVDTVKRTYEVVEIHHLTPQQRYLATQQLGISDETDIPVLGCLMVKPAIIAHAYSNSPRPDEVTFDEGPMEEILLEDDIISKFERGMKMQLVMCELSNGLKFIKEVLDVRVSFDELIPQSLLVDYKQPVPNQRPAPSIHTIKDTSDCLDNDLGEI